MDPVRVGVVGCGYWGPNLVRNFRALPEFRVVGLCDQNLARARTVADQLMVPRAVASMDELFEDESLEAVAIATPISTHADLARRALEANKHVLVEKPMADSSAACQELIELARERERVLLVDHTYLYTGAVEAIRKLIDEGALGRIYYFDSVRVNLGLFQHDANVIWDLAPHDLSIMLHVIDEQPTQVTAVGAAPVDPNSSGLESIAYVTVRFESGILGHVHVNWLAPRKIRLMLIGGSKQMVVFDDMERDLKVQVFDKGVDPQTVEGRYETMLDYRSGDMFAPRLDPTEALRKECLHLYRCVREGEAPLCTGELGRDVVRILECAQESLDRGGAPVSVQG